MKAENTNSQSLYQKQALRTLCRFLSVRFSYRFLLILLSATGILFSLTGRTLFAPYGIALLSLILPSFLSNSLQEQKKEENSDIPLASLYQRYHYSPVTFSCYRITLFLAMLLLFIWHMIQSPKLLFLSLSLPLLYLVLLLGLGSFLNLFFYLLFHRRLMSGTL